MDKKLNILEQLRQQWANRLGSNDDSDWLPHRRITPDAVPPQAPPPGPPPHAPSPRIPQAPPSGSGRSFFGPPPGVDPNQVEPPPGILPQPRPEPPKPESLESSEPAAPTPAPLKAEAARAEPSFDGPTERATPVPTKTLRGKGAPLRLEPSPPDLPRMHTSSLPRLLVEPSADEPPTETPTETPVPEMEASAFLEPPILDTEPKPEPVAPLIPTPLVVPEMEAPDTGEPTTTPIETPAVVGISGPIAQPLPADAPPLGGSGLSQGSTTSRPRHAPPPKLWSLALQGGGPLGAYTWGVLDSILEDGGIMPAALSGASAGAVNACVLASHWTTGGADAAAEALARVWQKVSEAARFTPFGDFPLMPKLGAEAGAAAIDMMTHMFSPYQFNPMDRNPLRDILAAEVDIEALRHRHCPRLFISATRISDGACRIFTNETITLEAILASATLPLLHQAVEIEGEYYWDGGYTANPPIRPLANSFRHLPILLVELMPAQRHAELPRSPREINDRLNHIVFSRPLLDELRAISERPSPPHIERLTIGELPENQASLDWQQLQSLFAQGRNAATDWIAAQHQMSFRH